MLPQTNMTVGSPLHVGCDSGDVIKEELLVSGEGPMDERLIEIHVALRY
jgi:hypothetical protein